MEGAGRHSCVINMDTTIPSDPAISARRRTARTVGFLYLFTNATAIFAFSARGKLIIPGNAVQTAANIAGSEQLFRFGIAIPIGIQEKRLAVHQSKVSEESMLSIRYGFAET